MCEAQEIVDRPDYSEGTKVIIDETSSMAAAWCAIICAFLGVVGNMLTIFVLMSTKTMRRHSTTPFLMSLAASDLIFCGFNLPLMAVRFWYRDWIFGLGPTCTLYTFFFYANVSVSAFSMALVAINRLVGIYFPHKMDIFSTGRAWMMVTLVWGISLGLMLLPLTEVWGQLGYEPLTFSCTIMEKNGSSPMAFLLTFGFLAPFLSIAVGYGLIFYRVKKTGDLVRKTVGRADSDAALQHHLRRREVQMTKTVLLVCLGYVACFLPSCVLMVFDPMPPCRGYPGLHVAGYVIFWCSGFINPLIYIFSNPNYRNACIGLFTNYKCGTTSSVPPTVSSRLARSNQDKESSLDSHELRRLNAEQI